MPFKIRHFVEKNFCSEKIEVSNLRLFDFYERVDVKWGKNKQKSEAKYISFQFVQNLQVWELLKMN